MRPTSPWSVERTKEAPLEPRSIIRGAEQLVEIFGGWPSFHDSEILDIHLERRTSDESEGAVLSIRFHLFQGRRDPSNASGVSWYNHTQATLRFSNITELELGDFNHQNAIFDLQFEDAGRHPNAPGLPAFRVRIQPAYGVGASFLCAAIEVSDLEPGLPPGSVYA